MSNVRMTGGRSELNAAWAQINALFADVTATLSRVSNAAIARVPLAALVADLAALRTTLAAAVVDLGVLRTPTAALIVDAAAALTRYENGATGNGAIADGTTAGRLKTVNAVDYRIAGALYTKAATDDLWNLSGETALGAAEYKAYWLYLDASGTASIAGGTVAASAAAAIAALPAVTSTKSVIGVFVGSPNCNFANALAAQGTIYNGWPSAYAPTAATPAALTASAPAAMTASATNGIANGTTAGTLKTRADVEYAIGGVHYTKAAADDLWDLSAETDTTGAQYRAYHLYLDASGTATIGASSNAASAAAAIAALPSVPSTKAVIGVYVAGLSTDFNGAGGLAAQGTIYEGLPSAYTLTATSTTLVAA